MLLHNKLFEDLVNTFRRLPGVGKKTAERYALYILSSGEEDVSEFVRVVSDVRSKIKRCSECQDFSETDPCSICLSTDRDGQLLCVVEKPSGVVAIERSGGYRGKYYVLNGLVSPLDGIGPEELGLSRLFHRVKSGGVREVIIATGATSEGEATALYIAHQLKPLGIKVSRIAHGVPMGAGLELTDEYTLRQALEWRKPLD
ncbi:MAG TPA: recombination mediator RecR [Candidatus Hydrogenedens sp.]|nr:recombination mediator RecR [Candidatus Hydrogenedens sp.]HOK09336.1 recombination mediator RecR [Candidatus Hydrogenedens sp.]HOL19803.1 recombination mediator RecR [Candidatus Hydrogenedens sp.]HPP58594.1 recombination mediator RecR [Candidatus Hydrogenedens sp.]